MCAKKKTIPGKPSEMPAPGIEPEITPSIEPEYPHAPEEEPDEIPSEEPGEPLPREIPPPGKE